MDFTSFKSISENQFEIGIKNAKDTQIYTQRGPPATDSGRHTPLVSETEREGTSDERISPAEVPGHGVSTIVLPAARRIQRYPRIGRRMAGAPLTSMHGGTAALLAVAGCSGAVQHGQGLLRASPSHYGSNAPKSKRNGAETSEVRRCGALRRGRSNSDERFTALDGLSPR